MHPPLQGIRAVVFDAVGTLIHPDPPAPVVYAEVGQRFGSRRTPAAIAPRFAAAFAREEAWDREHCFRTDEAREVRRWRAIVARVLDDVTDAEACFQELYGHFSRPEAWRCEPEAATTLAALAAGGYVLGLASNYDHRLHRVAGGLPPLQPLTHLVISSEVGWRKPAAAFFAALCQTLGLTPETILYVGDDPANDLEGARAAGLAAVLFDPRAKHVAAFGPRLGRLEDLVQGHGLV